MILIMGLPNAGKTTYSARYDNVLHLDDFGRHKFIKCNREVAKSDGNVVVEGIYNMKYRRKELLEALKGKDCKKICIWLDISREECERRERRGRNVVRYTLLEAPTYDEGWDEIIHLKE